MTPLYFFQGLRKVVFGVYFCVQALILTMVSFEVISLEILDSIPSYLSIIFFVAFYLFVDHYASKQESSRTLTPIQYRIKILWGGIFLIFFITAQIHRTLQPPIFTTTLALGILFLIIWFMEGKQYPFAFFLALACIFIGFLPLFSIGMQYQDIIENMVLGAALILGGIFDHHSLTAMTGRFANNQ